MTKRHITIGIGLLFVLVNTLAQFDEKARIHLDHLANTVTSSEGTSLVFEAKVRQVNSEEVINEDAGELLIKGDAYKLVIGETVTYCDGKDQWLYMSDVNEVTIEPLEGDEITPASIFSLYKEGYKFRTLEESDDKVVVELSPTDKTSPYIRVSLFINKTNQQLDAFSAQTKNGYITSVKITEWKNQPIESTDIKFDASKYTGTEIIDLR